jgi:hypothetical protein
VEFDILEQFVLDGIVLALCYGIILRIATLCHTYLNAWHQSATAQLYTPKVFENKKKSSAYWL